MNDPISKLGRINGSYDNILDAQLRLGAVFDEVGRLAALPPEAWKPLVAPVAHNQRHLLCGGLRRTLVEHALQAARLARELSAGSSTTAGRMGTTRHWASATRSNNPRKREKEARLRREHAR